MPANSNGSEPQPADSELPSVQANKTSGARPAAPQPMAVGAPLLSAIEFEAELEDAEHLMKYAAEMGIGVGEDVRRAVLTAKMASGTGWSPEVAAALLSALTTLSDKLRPVSGLSLRKCVVDEEATATIATLRRASIGLGLFIIPFSIAAFVASATCDAIHRDIDAGNALVVTLVRALPSTAGTAKVDGQAAGSVPASSESDLRDLQLLAVTIRATQTRARRLNNFGGNTIKNRAADTDADFELPVPVTDFNGATVAAVKAYQRTRYFAQGVQEAVLTTFGALTTCLLPVLYALLGTCARLLRLFERQREQRTFTGADRPTAHFLISAIGGFVVGLFGNLGAEHGGSVLPPLAIAFLVGYGANVFFAYLDGLLSTFRGSGASAGDEGTESRQPRAQREIEPRLEQ